jgi:hypothetical protein
LAARLLAQPSLPDSIWLVEPVVATPAIEIAPATGSSPRATAVTTAA